MTRAIAPAAAVPNAARAENERSLGTLVEQLQQRSDLRITTWESGQPRERTHAQLYEDVRSAQDTLRSWGVTESSRAGLWGANTYAWVVYELALLDLGAVTVTLPLVELSQWTAEQLVEHYKLDLLLADADRHDQATLPCSATLTLADQSAPQVGHTDHTDVGADVFTLVFSSGTTGAVKCIQINRAATERCLRVFGRDYAFSRDDCIFVALPLSTFQQRLMLYAALWYGFECTLVEPSPMAMVALRSAGATIMGGPPAFYEILESEFTRQRLWKQLAARGASRALGVLPSRAGSSLRRRLFARAHAAYGGRMRLMLSGSAPLRPSTSRVFETVGLPLFQLYGLTESGFIAWNHPKANRIGSVGRPVFDGSVRIAEDGEVLVRWPLPQSNGYYLEPDAVQEGAFRPNGEVATGDLGYLDEDGFLFLIGRKKDVLVLASGHKVPPSPVEQAVLACPPVAQAVLLTVLDRSALGLVVALHKGSGAEAGARVHRHIRDLASTEPNIAQVSRLLIVDDEFTRANGLLTSTMKLNRKAVEEQYGEALEAAPRVGG